MLQYASDACIVGAAVVFAFAVGRRGAGASGPFVLGPVVAAVGLGAYAMLPVITLALIQASAAEASDARARLRPRHMIVVPAYVSFGLCCGLIAGSLPSYWPDLVLAPMIFIFGIVVPLALLPLMKRRFGRPTNKPNLE